MQMNPSPSPCVASEIDDKMRAPLDNDLAKSFESRESGGNDEEKMSVRVVYNAGEDEFLIEVLPSDKVCCCFTLLR